MSHLINNYNVYNAMILFLAENNYQGYFCCLSSLHKMVENYGGGTHSIDTGAGFTAYRLYLTEAQYTMLRKKNGMLVFKL